MSAIQALFKNSWKFFSETDVPGVGISFATLAIGLVLVSVAFQFLSIMLGHNIGEADFSTFDRIHYYKMGSFGSSKYRISPGRQLDVR